MKAFDSFAYWLGGRHCWRFWAFMITYWIACNVLASWATYEVAR